MYQSEPLNGLGHDPYAGLLGGHRGVSWVLINRQVQADETLLCHSYAVLLRSRKLYFFNKNLNNYLYTDMAMFSFTPGIMFLTIGIPSSIMYSSSVIPLLRRTPAKFFAPLSPPT